MHQKDTIDINSSQMQLNVKKKENAAGGHEETRGLRQHAYGIPSQPNTQKKHKLQTNQHETERDQVTLETKWQTLDFDSSIM